MNRSDVVATVSCGISIQKTPPQERSENLVPWNRLGTMAISIRFVQGALIRQGINSYSGNFGYGEFPFHTDLAHWYIPPRYLVLRCAIGAPGVKTRILDSVPLVEKLGHQSLSRALVQPRTPITGHRLVLRLFDCESHGTLFRWDSLFLLPANTHGEAMVGTIAEYLRAATATEIALNHTGDTLVIDNWRILHGRSAVSKSERERKIDRAYLSTLQCA